MAFYNNRSMPYQNPFLPTNGNIHFGGYGTYGNAPTSSYGSPYGNQYARSGVSGYGRPTTTAYYPYATMGQQAYMQRYQPQQPTVVYAAAPKKDEFNWKKFAVNTGSVVAALGIAALGVGYFLKRNSSSMLSKMLAPLGFSAKKEEGGMEKSAAQFIMKTGKELLSEEVLTPDIRQTMRGELKQELKSMLKETTAEVLADEKFMTDIKGQMGKMLKGTTRDLMNDPKFMATVEKKIAVAVQNSTQQIMADQAFMTSVKGQMGKMLKGTTQDVMDDPQFMEAVEKKIAVAVQNSTKQMMADKAFMTDVKGEMGKMLKGTTQDVMDDPQFMEAVEKKVSVAVQNAMKEAVAAYKATGSWFSKVL